MAKVFFKRGLASEYGSNEPNLEDSIIFKSNVAPQLSGFSEIYLGSKLVGVGHQFGYGFAGIVPAPSELDRGKILSTDGWMSPEDIQGATDVYQNPIGGSSQDRYPLLLKGTADVAPETGDVNFSGMLRNGNPILSATAGGDMFAKSLTALNGSIIAKGTGSLVKGPGFKVTNTDGTDISAITTDTYIKADGSGYGGVFTGAGEAAGSTGLVPAPAIGDAEKYLKGDGTWGTVTSGVQSDWEEDDNTDLSYVQNRPAVRAGTGTNAVIEGDIVNNVASGQYSHAEGSFSKASGSFSHAEGIGTIAAKERSHAEGFGYAHNPQYYADSVFKLTGNANQTVYDVDTTDDIFTNMMLYYNGNTATIMSIIRSATPKLVLSNTLDQTNALANTSVKIVSGYAGYMSAHSEGGETMALGNGSHSEGRNTIAVNSCEHAQGQYNKPHTSGAGGFGNAGNTLNSIGIGTSDTDRKNAVEVMQNGDVYVYGVGSYNGTNPNTTGVKTLQAAINNPPEYLIEKLGTAETGYISSYVLKKDGVQAGATINIPKDYLVKSGSVVEVVLYNGHYYESTDTGHTTQLDGYGVNAAGKYLKFVINTADSQAGTGNTSYIYIAVQDLADEYTEGNGIDISASNVVSIQLDSANANGLETTSAGLKLNTVTTTANGAMLATDKVKLDSINGNYWGSQTLSAAANYITTPEFKQVTINGSTTNAASTDHCIMVYDTTNKCVKFTF